MDAPSVHVSLPAVVVAVDAVGSHGLFDRARCVDVLRSRRRSATK